jgi:hypothetical protein
MNNQRQKLELSDIFAERADSFLQHHRICEIQRKALKDITACRTKVLGGHQNRCNTCKHTQNAYNSCRNRHCPKCQFIKKVQWIDKLAANLPKVKYFHLVFTIPESLNSLFYLNQQAAYNILFKAAGKAMNSVAQNTKYLGAKTGAVGILHTWGQTLTYHPHIHMIVPAGGLSEDYTEWIPSHKKFLLPVKSLSMVYRGIMMDLLQKAYQAQTIRLPDKHESFEHLKQECYRKKWVVYCEKPFDTPKHLINYLGNYTHRVAITNHRLIKHEAGRVSFSYKDYKAGGKSKVLTLDTDEFIRRFLQHILPSGFSKIRYFGFLALRHLHQNTAICCELLSQSAYLPKYVGLSAFEVFMRITKKDPFRCPGCGTGRLIAMAQIPRSPT